MKCEEKVGEYCRQAIKYQRYVKYRQCNKCCIGCENLCGNVCHIALDIMESWAYDPKERRKSRE